MQPGCLRLPQLMEDDVPADRMLRTRLGRLVDAVPAVHTRFQRQALDGAEGVPIRLAGGGREDQPAVRVSLPPRDHPLDHHIRDGNGALLAILWPLTEVQMLGDRVCLHTRSRSDQHENCVSCSRVPVQSKK